MEREGSVEEDGGVSVLVNEDVKALIVSTSGNFDRQLDNRLGSAVDLVSTALAVLLWQLLIPHCFAEAFWVPICDVFVLHF